MAIDRSIESKIHRRAAAIHQSCADYHIRAAELIDKNNLEEAKAVSKNAMNYGKKAYSETLAACVDDMPWDLKFN